MQKIDISLVAGLILAVFISSFAGFARDYGEVREGVLRLHILANSDSTADQELKLQVRDRVLNESAAIFTGSYTKQEAEAAAKLYLPAIEAYAKDEIAARGYEYPVKAKLVNMYFESRSYGDTVFPAGRYDAVRLEIGAARGQNWWCVMFPPMCLPAAEEKQNTQELLPVEAQIARLNEQPRYVPKLAVLEFVNELWKDDAEDQPLEPGLNTSSATSAIHPVSEIVAPGREPA
jgi:stage II sporulation protein R